MTQAVLGIIGGSGIYDLPGLENAREEAIRSPWGEPSAPVRHGTIAGLRIVFLPRHDKGHRLSPSDINYRANIDVLKRAGVTDLVSLSACGSFREELPPGTFVLVDQFVDRTHKRETSFFGKGQFIPATAMRQNGAYVFRQSLEAPYYQPLLPPQRVTSKNWGSVREQRRKTQVCQLAQSAMVTERAGGFDLRMESRGTAGVPVAVEISLREGGTLEGCRPAPHVEGGWLLEGDRAVYKVGGAAVRFGPGAAPHLQTQLRGAEG